MLLKTFTEQHVLRAVALVAVASLLPKAAMVVRELTVAAKFGASDAVDAFLLALLLPTLIVQIVVQAFAVGLIPGLIRCREQRGAEPARELAAGATGMVIATLVGISLLLVVLHPLLFSLLGAGFSDQKRELAGTYFYWLAPVIVLQGAATIWGSMVNAGGRFGAVALVPVVTPVLIILVLELRVPGGMEAVAAATLAGAAVEAGLSYLLARRAGLPGPHLRWDDDLRKVIIQALHIAAGMALINGNLLIDQVFASTTGTGGIALLNYGSKVVSFILAMAAMPLGVVALPHFSVQAARQDIAGMKRSLKLWTLILVLLALPFTAVMVAVSDPLAELLFLRGNFASSDIPVVALIQTYLMLQIPFYLLSTISGRMMTALGLNHLVLKIAGVNFLVNMIANFLFIKWLGLPGIALSTSLVYFLSTIMVYIVLIRRLR